MSYTIDRTFEGEDFDAVVARTRAALADQGFGVLCDIDVKTTLKKKIDADIDDYLILGACNPHMAKKALEIEPRVGTMLPCNVILRSTGDGAVEVGEQGIKEAGHVEQAAGLVMEADRKSTRLNSSHIPLSRMPSSA